MTGDPLLLKYLFWPPLLLAALWWLVRGGRPRGGRPPYPKAIFLGALALTTLFFGFALGALPNPMAAAVETVTAPLAQLPWKLLALGFFSLLAVLGTKLICGWGCPFGALQELLYELPVWRRTKGIQLPFFATMAVRTLVFAGFIFLFFATASRPTIYRYFDPFTLFGPYPIRTALLLPLALLLVAALFLYRPFCQFLCPFGWYSWFLERFSLFQIRIDRRRCCRCNACARACPLEAARGRLEGWPVKADCFSCARCLRVCPAGAIRYGREDSDL